MADLEPQIAKLEKASLDSLQPTENSLPWFRQRGMTREAEALEAKTNEAINKLKNYKDNPFMEKDAMNYLRLAAKSTSTELRDWVSFNMYYSHPVVEPETDKGWKDWHDSDAEYLRNVAVVYRERSKGLQEEGKNEEAGRVLDVAQRCFNSYLRTTSGKNILIPVDKVREIFIEQEDSTEITSLFFRPEVRKAEDEFMDSKLAMREGELQVPGIDAGLIRVYFSYGISPQSLKENFPQVIEEIRKLRKYCGDKHGVTVEEMDKFADYEGRLMFPDK